MDSSVSAVQLVSEYGQDNHGTPQFRSIRVVVELFAENAEIAVEIGSRVTDVVTRVMEFQVGARHQPSRVVALWDATPGIDRRIFKQWAYDLLVHPSSRVLHIPELQVPLNSLEAQSPKDTTSIMRGIKWYTDALAEPETIDRFLKLWVGLESIGSILNRRFHPGGWAICKRCLGKESNRQRDERPERGIRHLFSVADPNKPQIFDALRLARNKLVHSEWELSRVMAIVDPLLESAAKALGSGLLTVLAPSSAAQDSRDAAEPLSPLGERADFSVTTEALSDNPDSIGELTDTLVFDVEITESEEVDLQYQCKVNLRVEGAFPFDVTEFVPQSEHTLADGIVVDMTNASHTAEVVRVPNPTRTRRPTFHGVRNVLRK